MILSCRRFCNWFYWYVITGVHTYKQQTFRPSMNTRDWIDYNFSKYPSSRRFIDDKSFLKMSTAIQFYSEFKQLCHSEHYNNRLFIAGHWPSFRKRKTIDKLKISIVFQCFAISISKWNINKFRNGLHVSIV